MGTRNTSDNTYYSLCKGFQFSSIISILAPLVYIILTVVKDCMGGDTLPEWYVKGIIITGSIAFAFAAIWVVLSFVMFFTAGNLRGKKSPLGIRIALLIAIIFVSAAEIISVLKYADVIPNFEKDIFNQLIHYGTQVVVMIGYIIGIGLSASIKKALKR